MKLQGSNILGQEQIDLLTTRGLNFVWFPKQLETIYRFQYQNGAAYEFRYRAPIILILYIFLSFGIYQVLPSEQVLSWFSFYSWVGVIVLIAWILSFIKKLNQYFDYYVGVGSALAVAITLPLWAGYLVKIIAMRLVFTEQGFFNWALAPFGLSGPTFSIPIVILTLTYLWFPYMALPVFTAIRQIPPNLFDASSDMGAKGFTTIYRVVLPLIVPAVIAGSVFTFSLSLGDYIAAKFTGGSTQMIGSIIAANINLNPPVAAAFSMVPIAFVVIYLMVARRTGSLERM